GDPADGLRLLRGEGRDAIVLCLVRDDHPKRRRSGAALGDVRSLFHEQRFAIIPLESRATMIAALRKLSEQIDAEWKAAGYKPGHLPAIASRALAESRPDRDYDLGALADWTLTEPAFPDACNPFGPLGPPAFTVWSNPHFFVNVYVYTTPEVVVHDHDFSGAFMNLSCVTIHSTYE